MGIEFREVGLLQATLFWIIFFSEIPTGFFADRYKRKFSLAIGCLLLLLGYLVFTLEGDFLVYLGAFLCLGLGMAMLSGANEALLFDGLKEAGPKAIAQYESHLGKARFLSAAGMAGALFVSGWLYEHQANLIFTVSGLFALFAAGLFFFLDEPSTCNISTPTYRSIISDSITLCRSKKGQKLIFFISGTSLLEAAHTPFFVYGQAFFEEAGLESKPITIILGCSFLVTALSSLCSRYLNGISLLKKIIITVLLLISGLMLLDKDAPTGLNILLFILINALPNLLFIFTDAHIQNQVESNIRSSMLSLHSFITSVAIGLSWLAVGFIADNLGTQSVLMYFAFLSLLSGLSLSFYFIWTKKCETGN
jgi:MFS family permease